MRQADSAAPGIRNQHRHAVRKEQQQRHIAQISDQRISSGNRICQRQRSCADKRLIHHGNLAAMHLRACRQACSINAHRLRKALAVTQHQLRLIANMQRQIQRTAHNSTLAVQTAAARIYHTSLRQQRERAEPDVVFLL